MGRRGQLAHVPHVGHHRQRWQQLLHRHRPAHPYAQPAPYRHHATLIVACPGRPHTPGRPYPRATAPPRATVPPRPPAPQATRKGWPYYTRCPAGQDGGDGGGVYYSRGDPRGVNLRPPQATRKGWPYSIRAARAAWKAVVYSRATPISVNLSPCARDAGHPQGVALLYAAAPQALRHVRLS